MSFKTNLITAVFFSSLKSAKSLISGIMVFFFFSSKKDFDNLRCASANLSNSFVSYVLLVLNF